MGWSVKNIDKRVAPKVAEHPGILLVELPTLFLELTTILAPEIILVNPVEMSRWKVLFLARTRHTDISEIAVRW